jgi:hypothetical protein
MRRELLGRHSRQAQGSPLRAAIRTASAHAVGAPGGSGTSAQARQVNLPAEPESPRLGTLFLLPCCHGGSRWDVELGENQLAGTVEDDPSLIVG